jgi:hypothetical protein
MPRWSGALSRDGSRLREGIQASRIHDKDTNRPLEGVPSRYSCGFETIWPAARGRHESARHNGRAPARTTLRPISGTKNGTPAGNPRQLAAPAKIDRLLDELRKQQEEVLQALGRRASWCSRIATCALARPRRSKADLSAIYEVLERNRVAWERRLAALVR